MVSFSLLALTSMRLCQIISSPLHMARHTLGLVVCSGLGNNDTLAGMIETAVIMENSVIILKFFLAPFSS